MSRNNTPDIIVSRGSATGTSHHAARGSTSAPGERALRSALRDVLADMGPLRQKMGLRPVGDFKPDYPLEKVVAVRLPLLSQDEQTGFELAVTTRLHGRPIADLPPGAPGESDPGSHRPR